MHQILLIEDSKEVFNQVNAGLSGIAQIHWAASLAEGRDFVAENPVSLVLLDVELPDGSGVDLCNEFQSEYPAMPVFFLSAHAELPEKVMGFAAGAEDYITKPFQTMELKARVEAKLRKIDSINSSRSDFSWQELEVLRSRQEVFVKEAKERKSIPLTALEFKILSYFCDRPGEVIHRDDILNEVWGTDVHVYPRSVDTHVSKLRRKIKPADSTIKSVHGVGYKFEPTP